MQASWVEVYRALRHRTLNRLQVAHGWAQLGEGEASRLALEEYLLEEQVLSALLAAASRREQRVLLSLLARCERDGRKVHLKGEPKPPGAGELSQALEAMQGAVRTPRTRPLEIAVFDGSVRVTLLD